MQQPDEVLDRYQRSGLQTGAVLAPQSYREVTDGLVDLLGSEAEVLFKIVARKHRKRHELHLAEVAEGGRGDDRIEAVLLKLGGEGLVGYAGALTPQPVLAGPSG